MDTKSDNFNRLYSSASSHLSFLVPSSGLQCGGFGKEPKKAVDFISSDSKTSLLLAKM